MVQHSVSTLLSGYAPPTTNRLVAAGPGGHQTFRWAGLLALLGGLALGWLIAHYVLRPVRADKPR